MPSEQPKTTLTDGEKEEVRVLCGYRQADGLLTYRLGRLTCSEQAVVRQYSHTLGALAEDPTTRTIWQRRLCAFLGVPPGPEVAP